MKNFSIIKTNDSRGTISSPPETIKKPETEGQLLPCQFNFGDLSTCELKL